MLGDDPDYGGTDDGTVGEGCHLHSLLRCGDSESDGTWNIGDLPQGGDHVPQVGAEAGPDTSHTHR